MTNNKLVRLVNRHLSKGKGYGRLLFNDDYQIIYVCSPLRLMIPIKRLAFRKGVYMYQTTNCRGWHELCRQSFLIDTLGKVFLEVP